MLTTDPSLTGDELLETIEHTVAHSGGGGFELVLRGVGTRHPAAIILEVLSLFGAVTDAEHPVILPLVRWAMTEISTREVALADRSHTGSAPPADTVCQLKILLTCVRPPCWRRVLVPATATLGDLHYVIQIALDWDDDHLHLFTLSRRLYGDPAFDAEFNEDDMTLGDAFNRRPTISYVYDLGDNGTARSSWKQHTNTIPRPPTPPAPKDRETLQSKTGAATDPTQSPSTRLRSTLDLPR